MAQLTATLPRRASWTSLDRIGQVLGWLTFISMSVTLYGVFTAPMDLVQGDVQRIFYFHVPLALLSYVAFGIVCIGGIAYLWKRDERWDRWARSSVEVGVLFTTLALVTGSIWARPIWGTWWQWDPRLTSYFVLWFLYIGYIMVRSYVPDKDQAARFGAVLGIVAFLDVPIVQMSIVWWRGIHPGPTIITESGSVGMPTSMLMVLALSMVAFSLLYGLLLVQRVRLEQLKDVVARWEGEQGWGGDRA